MRIEKLKLDNHWAIYKCGKEYMVHNRNFHFEQGHCHVKTYKAADSIVYVCKKKVIPRHWSLRMLQSLARVADTEHANKVLELIREKVNKGKQETKKRRAV